MKALRVALLVLASPVLGAGLARWIDSWPRQIPPLIETTQWVLGFTDTANVHNPDMVFDTAGLIVLAACILLVGVVPYFVYRSIVSWRHRGS